MRSSSSAPRSSTTLARRPEPARHREADAACSPVTTTPRPANSVIRGRTPVAVDRHGRPATHPVDGSAAARPTARSPRPLRFCRAAPDQRAIHRRLEVVRRRLVNRSRHRSGRDPVDAHHQAPARRQANGSGTRAHTWSCRTRPGCPHHVGHDELTLTTAGAAESRSRGSPPGSEHGLGRYGDVLVELPSCPGFQWLDRDHGGMLTIPSRRPNRCCTASTICPGASGAPSPRR